MTATMKARLFPVWHGGAIACMLPGTTTLTSSTTRGTAP